MAPNYSPPDSPLSSAMDSSDGFDDDDHRHGHGHGHGHGHDYDEPSTLRPSKRQKIKAGSVVSSSTAAATMMHEQHEHEHEHEHDHDHNVPEPDPLEGMSDVSSDTSGDIPSSPVHARLEEDDFQDQVSVCEWEGCQAGDTGNMDRLVEHIHNSHIENRQKKYTCEWRSCNRKGLPHASGYALKAHMRSHTREKPFYCYLPECDRSFTRSDALAKHMRTVHETEALRPSDPVPKSMQAGPTGRTGKLKIIIKTPQSHSAHSDGLDESTEEDHTSAEYFTLLSGELFTPAELACPVDKLYRKCHWEAKWADEVGEALRKECKQWEEVYYKEWLEKEVLLSQVIQSEVDWHERRQAVLAGEADVQLRGKSKREEKEEEKEEEELEMEEDQRRRNGVEKESREAIATSDS